MLATRVARITKCCTRLGGEIIAAELAQVGIEAKIENVERNGCPAYSRISSMT